ncbi:MAG: SpoIIE family protein phosphatase [Candidatus Cloacimonetes bacterium]|nr:SpoIIE family protein phosphatase [Candidatus Cloacimonadota bacterium]
MAYKNEDRTLAYHLISFVFVFMLIIFLASILITRSLYHKIMLDNQLDNMRHLAHERIYLIDGILFRIEGFARVTRKVLSEHDITVEKKEIFLHDILLDNPQIHSICIAENLDKGIEPTIHFTLRHRYTTRSISGLDYRFQDWFQIPHITELPYWSEPWVDTEGKGELVISYSLPIFEAGKGTGMIRFDIELGYLQELISGSGYFKIGSSFLVSTTGALVAHRNSDLIMNQSLFSLAEEYNDKDLSDLGYAMVSGKQGHVRIRGNSPFRKAWIYYQPLLSNRWSVGVAIDENYLMRDVNLVLMIQTVAYILIFLSVAIMIYARVLNVSRPLKRLAQVADRIGTGDFNAQIPVSDKTAEIATLAQSFSAMQASLKDYIKNLRITTEEKNQIRGDVIYASEIQNKLIPVNSEHPFGINELRAYGILEPAGDIGGDLYDYFLIDDEHFCFVIADVLGKGIGAAMAMTMASTLLPSIAPFYKTSSELLLQLNNFLCRNNIETNFVTALLGILDLKTGTLQYSNCGHVPLYIRRMDRSFIKYGETHSTALGVFENLEIGSDEIQLNMGDEIILFTDGITEAMNAHDEFLGLTGLETILGKLTLSNPEITAKKILEEVHIFAKGARSKDDITLLVIDYKHPEIG